jgi:hypothetical protein
MQCAPAHPSDWYVLLLMTFTCVKLAPAHVQLNHVMCFAELREDDFYLGQASDASYDPMFGAYDPPFPEQVISGVLCMVHHFPAALV